MGEHSRAMIRLLRGLRAVREYRSEPVSDEALQDILDVGRWSGSASNAQPTEVVVVRDGAMKQKLGESGAGPAARAAVAILIVTPGNAERRDLEVFDEGRLVERLLLAAKAHGLGGNVAWLKGEGPNNVKQALGIPPERRAVSVVTIGHTDIEARRNRPPRPNAGRKSSDTFVHWDQY